MTPAHSTSMGTSCDEPTSLTGDAITFFGLFMTTSTSTIVVLGTIFFPLYSSIGIST